MKSGRKLIDPCLRCYIGAYFMCISNDGLKKDGTGNGTQGRLVGMKLKEDATTLKWKVWDNKKVWTVCASDVEWVEFHHHPKTQEIVKLEKVLETLKQNGTEDNESHTKLIEQKLHLAIGARKF